jgi:putative tryptophan/tyrosine transport system substrate-binding protein
MKRRDFIGLILGTVGAWPRSVVAQQQSMPVIGFLNSSPSGRDNPLFAPFLAGLREAGYVEGQNVSVEFLKADGHYDRLPALAVDLVSRKVDVIVTTGGNLTALAAKRATSTIPVVFETGDDPLREGLVASLARPGGNLTGISILFTELVPKLLELLSELPKTGAIGLLVKPSNASAERIISDSNEAARIKGVTLQIVKAENEGEIDTAFASLAEQRVGALVIAADPLFFIRRAQLVALAARYKIPTIYFTRALVASGGLMSYGPNLAAIYHQLGIYTGKILKGAKPADLPVEQPTTFEFVINLKTANTLGLSIPPALLAQADEVIE